MADFLFSEGPIEALQRLSPYLDGLFIAITTSGGGIVLMGLSLLLYWLWDKRAGFMLATLVLVSGALNGSLKEVFQTSRPPAHLRLVSEQGYDFPSGHAQQSATFWSGVALLYRGVWIVVAPVLIILVSLSRVYLGVHYVGSVLSGVAMGVPLAVAGYLLQRAGFWGGMSFGARLLVGALWPIVLAPMYIFGLDMLRVVGMLSGFSAGYLLEGRLVDMGPPRGLGVGAYRAVVGLPSLGALYWVTLSVAEPLAILLIHVALGLLAAFLLPWAFVVIEGRLLTGEGST